ncbi:chaperone NapD [Bacillus sp. Marseille-P3661]|uniref:chaperone NapD n=1 Tax=Bacillus sp. Marseille-P3661 TaxID=1936234 RepID=UPI000C854B7F|nr:chaperone NapD [Bacillus sp. Marseille-P3661]
MMISGILISTKKGLADKVAIEVEKITGVEVHQVVDNNKIVITLEQKSIEKSYKTGKRLEKVPGVLGVNVVYYNCEEAEEVLAAKVCS